MTKREKIIISIISVILWTVIAVFLYVSDLKPLHIEKTSTKALLPEEKTEPAPRRYRTYEIEGGIKALLRDPNSAQFRYIKKNGRLFCGLVNSKNGFGGYNGEKRFVFTGDKLAYFEGTPLGGPYIWDAYCT